MFVGYQRGIAVGRGYLGPRDVTRKGAAGQRDAFFRAAAAVPKTVALVARIEPVARMKRQRNPGIGLPARASFPDFTSFHPGYKMLTEQPAQNVLAARFAPEFWPTKADNIGKPFPCRVRIVSRHLLFGLLDVELHFREKAGVQPITGATRAAAMPTFRFDLGNIDRLHLAEHPRRIFVVPSRLTAK